MPAQPSYLATGTTPLAGSTKRNLLEKWLGAVQNNASSAKARNNPKRTDTKRTLLVKIDRAKAGL